MSDESAPRFPKRGWWFVGGGWVLTLCTVILARAAEDGHYLAGAMACAGVGAAAEWYAAKLALRTSDRRALLAAGLALGFLGTGVLLAVGTGTLAVLSGAR
jgi:hypothetical protein